jgi:inner membrane protein involved in colicin E2 resistance
MEDGEKGVKKRVEHVAMLTATSFPHVLDVRGKLTPTERRHGLYTVTVYEFAGHLKGAVEIVQPQTTGTVEWGEPYLAMSVEDVRGIVGTPTVVVNGTPETMLQRAESTMGLQPNLRVPLRGMKELNGHLEFDMAFSALCRTLSAADTGGGRKRVFGCVGCFFIGDGNAGSDGVESGEADRSDECEPVDAD